MTEVKNGLHVTYQDYPLTGTGCFLFLPFSENRLLMGQVYIMKLSVESNDDIM